MINHKRGDTFRYAYPVPDIFPDGYFVDWTPRCQIRDLFGVFMAEATCAWVDIGTTRTLVINAEAPVTKTWTLGKLVADIQFSSNLNGTVYTLLTIQINCIRDITL